MNKGSAFSQIFPQFVDELLTVLRNAFILGISYVFALIVYNIYFHPLSSYPGPKLCAATRIPYFRSLLRGRLVREVAKWHEEYGQVVRIAPDELSYTSAAAWKDIYGGSNPKDTRFYSSPISDTSTYVQKEADQSRYRSSIAQTFSDFSLGEQEPVIKGYVDMLISRLHQQTGMGTSSIDMVSWYSFTTFDIIRDLAFGESFDCLNNAQYHEWISMVFSKIRVGVYLNVLKRIPGCKRLMRFLLPKVLPSRLKHQVLTAEGIENHFNGSDEKPTFLGHLLKQKNPSKKLTEPEILSNASAFILAGSETTATALCGITYYLLQEPRCMEKLVAEIHEAFDAEDQITFESLRKLKYTRAVVNEGLRMYPPVPIGLPRFVQGEGTTIDGQWVPGKTTVAVSQMSANRSPLNFDQPDKFIPERFLGDRKFVSDKRGALQPFLTGPRNCLGRNLAYAEMRLILARVLWNFDMELAPESIGINWPDQKTYFLWEKRPLKVRLTPVSRK